MNLAAGLLLFLSLTVSASAGDSVFEIRRVVDEGTPGAKEVEYVEQGEKTRKLFPEKDPVVTAAHLAKVQPFADPSSEAGIEIELTPTGGQLLTDLTRDAVGKILAVTVNGKVLTAPIVKVPITEGHLLITGSFSKEEAQAIVDLLNLAITKKAFSGKSDEATLTISGNTLVAESGGQKIEYRLFPPTTPIPGLKVQKFEARAIPDPLDKNAWISVSLVTLYSDNGTTFVLQEGKPLTMNRTELRSEDGEMIVLWSLPPAKPDKP